MSSAICFNLDKSKILSSGNGLRDIPKFKVLVDKKIKCRLDYEMCPRGLG